MSKAHHKISSTGVGRGQLPQNEMRGDASFRPYFVDEAAWAEAMSRAAWLEARNMPRRAWRVRLNVDGVQPSYASVQAALDDSDEDVENVEVAETLKEKRLKRNRLKALQRRVKKLKKELENA